MGERREAGFFERASKRIACGAGHSGAFAAALLSVAVWALCGPVFHFNDTWQLTINTATTIVTFLMVFLIQNSQNRDTLAIQVKLDELIRAAKGARNELIDIEKLSEKEIEALLERYERLASSTAKRKQPARKE